MGPPSKERLEDLILGIPVQDFVGHHLQELRIPNGAASIVVDVRAATDDVPKILNIDVDGGVGTTVVAGVVAGVSAAGWVTPASSDGCAGGVVIGV